MIKCKKCKKEIDDKLTKCPHCGTLLHEKNKKETSKEEKIAKGIVGTEAAVIGAAMAAAVKEGKEKASSKSNTKNGVNNTSKSNTNNRGNGSNAKSSDGQILNSEVNSSDESFISTESPVYMSNNNPNIDFTLDESSYNKSVTPNDYIDYNTTFNPNNDSNYKVVEDFLKQSSNGNIYINDYLNENDISLEELFKMISGESGVDFQETLKQSVNDYVKQLVESGELGDVSEDDINAIVEAWLKGENPAAVTSNIPVLNRNAIEEKLSEMLSEQFSEALETDVKVDFKLTEDVLDLKDITIEERDGQKVYVDKEGNVYNSLEALIIEHTEIIDYQKVLKSQSDYKPEEKEEERNYNYTGGRIDIDPFYLGKAILVLGGSKIIGPGGQGNDSGWDYLTKKTKKLQEAFDSIPTGKNPNTGKKTSKSSINYPKLPSSGEDLSSACESILSGAGAFSTGGDNGLAEFMSTLYSELSALKSKIDVKDLKDKDGNDLFDPKKYGTEEQQQAAFEYSFYLTADTYATGFGSLYGQSHYDITQWMEQYESLIDKHRDLAFQSLETMCNDEFDDYTKRKAIMDSFAKEEFDEHWRDEHGNLNFANEQEKAEYEAALAKYTHERNGDYSEESSNYVKDRDKYFDSYKEYYEAQESQNESIRIYHEQSAVVDFSKDIFNKKDELATITEDIVEINDKLADDSLSDEERTKLEKELERKQKEKRRLEIVIALSTEDLTQQERDAYFIEFKQISYDLCDIYNLPPDLILTDEQRELYNKYGEELYKKFQLQDFIDNYDTYSINYDDKNLSDYQREAIAKHDDYAKRLGSLSDSELEQYEEAERILNARKMLEEASKEMAVQKYLDDDYSYSIALGRYYSHSLSAEELAIFEEAMERRKAVSDYERYLELSQKVQSDTTTYSERQQWKELKDNLDIIVSNCDNYKVLTEPYEQLLYFYVSASNAADTYIKNAYDYMDLLSKRDQVENDAWNASQYATWWATDDNPTMTYDEAVQDSSDKSKNYQFLLDSIDSAKYEMQYDHYLLNCARQAIIALDIRQNMSLYDDYQELLNGNTPFMEYQVENYDYLESYYNRLFEAEKKLYEEKNKEYERKIKEYWRNIPVYGTDQDYDNACAQLAEYEKTLKPEKDEIESHSKYAASLQQMAMSYAAGKQLLYSKMPDRDQYRRESVIASYKTESTWSGNDAAGLNYYDVSFTFYDANGKRITDPDEIACYCVQNGILYEKGDTDSSVIGYPFEAVENLIAIGNYKYVPEYDSHGNPTNRNYNPYNFKTEDAYSSYYYLKDKYGIDVSKDSFDFYFDLGAKIIGYTLADARIKRIREACYSSGKEPSFWDDAKAFFMIVGQSLEDGLEGWSDNMNNLFNADGRVSSHEYRNQHYIEHLSLDEDFRNKLFENTYELGSSIGNMIPSILANLFVTAITCGAAAEATIPKLALDIIHFGTTFATMGLSAWGGAKEKAMQMGMDEVAASWYGFFSGLSETTLESVLGSLPGIGHMEKVLEGSSNVFVRFFGKMLSEGIEESTQEIFDSFLLAAFTGQPVDVDWNAVLKAGIYGAITSGIMSIGGSVINTSINGTILGNLALDSYLTGNTAKIDFLIAKYEGLNLLQKMTNQEFINDLTTLSTFDPTDEINKLNIKNSNDPKVKEMYESAHKKDSSLTFEKFVEKLSFKQLTGASVDINTAEVISERNEKLKEYEEKVKEYRKLQEKLGLSVEQIEDMIAAKKRNTTYEETMLIQKHAELVKMQNEINSLSNEIFESYKSAKEELQKRQSELDARESEMSAEEYIRELGEIEKLKSKVSAHEDYIMNKIDINTYINTVDTIRDKILYDENALIEKATTLDETEKLIEQSKTELEELLDERESSNETKEKIAEIQKNIEKYEALKDKLQRQIKKIDTRLKEHLDAQERIIDQKSLEIDRQNKLLAYEYNSRADSIENLQEEIDSLNEQLKSENDINKLREIKKQIEEKTEEITKLQRDQKTIEILIDKNNSELERITEGKITGINSESGPVGEERAKLLRAVGENASIVGLLPNLRQMIADTEMTSRQGVTSKSDSSQTSQTSQIGHVTVDSDGKVSSNFGSPIKDRISTKDVSIRSNNPVKERINLPRKIDVETVQNFLDIEDPQTCIEFLKNEEVKNVIINQYSDGAFDLFITQDIRGEKVRALFDDRGIEILVNSEQLNARLNTIFDNPRVKNILLTNNNFTEVLIENIGNLSDSLVKLNVNSIADRIFLDELATNINEGRVKSDEVLTKLGSQESAYIADRIGNVEETNADTDIEVKDKTLEVAKGLESYIEELENILNTNSEEDITEEVRTRLKSIAVEIAHNQFNESQYLELIAQLSALNELINSKKSSTDAKNSELFTQVEKNIDSLVKSLQNKLNEATIVSRIVDTTENRVLESDLAEDRFRRSVGNIEEEAVVGNPSQDSFNNISYNPNSDEGRFIEMIQRLNTFGINIDASRVFVRGNIYSSRIESLLEKYKYILLNNLVSYDANTASLVLEQLYINKVGFDSSLIREDVLAKFSKDNRFISLLSPDGLIDAISSKNNVKYSDLFNDRLIKEFIHKFKNGDSACFTLINNITTVENVEFFLNQFENARDKLNFINHLDLSVKENILINGNISTDLAALLMTDLYGVDSTSIIFDDYIRSLTTEGIIDLYRAILDIDSRAFFEIFGNLSIDNAVKVKDAIGNVMYKYMSIEQLTEIIGNEGTECVVYLSNFQKFMLSSKGVIWLSYEYLANSENYIGVTFTARRSDGTSFDWCLENIIKDSSENIYVYSINNHLFYSDSPISYDLYCNTALSSFIVNEFLSEERLSQSVQNNGYLGNFELDSFGALQINMDKVTHVSSIIDAYVNNFESFIDSTRDGNKQIVFGVDQRIRDVDGDRLFVDVDGSVETIDIGSYSRLVEYFSKKYNMSESTIRQTLLYVIDCSAGACSYADFANKIFYTFRNNAYAFKRTFGFDMYEFENGKKKLNSRMLLMDIFVRTNSVDIGISDGRRSPKIFTIDPVTHERVINSYRDLHGNIIYLNDSSQVYMSNLSHLKAATKYLSDYGITFVQERFNQISNGKVDIDALKADIRKRLLSGELLSIREHVVMETYFENGVEKRKLKSNQHNLIFHDLDKGLDTEILSWHEGGAHVTTIVGMTEEGLIVVSWGRKHLIKFTDLMDYNFALFSTKMDCANLRIMPSDLEIIDLISNLSNEELVDYFSSEAIAENLDFDYLLKNYISQERIQELVKIMDPSELLSKVKSARSVGLILESVKNSLGQESYNRLLSELTLEQRLNIYNSNNSSLSLKYDLVSKIITTQELLSTINLAENNMSSTDFAEFIKKLTIEQKIEFIQSNMSDEKKYTLLSIIKDDLPELVGHLNGTGIISLVNSFYETSDYLSILNLLSFNQLTLLVRNVQYGLNSEVLEALFKTSNNPMELTSFINSLYSVQKQMILDYINSRTSEEIEYIRSKFEEGAFEKLQEELHRESTAKMEEKLDKKEETTTLMDSFDRRRLDETITPIMEYNVTERLDLQPETDSTDTKDIWSEIESLRGNELNNYLAQLDRSELELFVLGLNPEQTTALINAGIDQQYLEINLGENKTEDTSLIQNSNPTQDEISVQKHIEAFFNFDNKVKQILSESAGMSVSELIDAIEKIDSYLYRMVKGSPFEMMLPQIDEKIKAIKEALNNVIDTKSLEQFREQYIYGLSREALNAIADSVVGYAFNNYGAALSKCNSLNEILHAIHHSALNATMYEKGEITPILFKGTQQLGEGKTSYYKEQIHVYGTYTELLENIYEALNNKVVAGETHILSLENKVLFMVRDSGHALTIEVTKLENGKVEVSYQFPKITNVKKANKVKGIQNVDSNSVFASGGFITTEEMIGTELRELIESIPTDEDMERLDRNSEDYSPQLEQYTNPTKDTQKHIDTLKDSILSKITPEMSELEKARLIYLELGKKLDYDPEYRYALRTKNADLYNLIYNANETMADVEKRKTIICATWVQIYTEMLVEAGLDRDSIIVQRLTTDPNVEGNNYVYNSHAAMYVVLPNGDMIIPDMTVPFTGAADFYNIKAGHETTGFIYVTKEQMKQISDDWKSYPNDDIEYYSNIVTSQNIDEDVRNFIEAAGSYFYGHVFSEETLSKLRSEHSDKFTNRRKQQNAFFNYFREKNSSIIHGADEKIQSFLTTSDFFYEKITEESRKFQAENDRAILKDLVSILHSDSISLSELGSLYHMLSSAFLGLDNVSNRNMGTILSYLRETADKEEIHYAKGKEGLSIKFILNTSSLDNSIYIYVYEDGVQVGRTIELVLNNNGELGISSSDLISKVDFNNEQIGSIYSAYEQGIISNLDLEFNVRNKIVEYFNIHDGYDPVTSHVYEYLPSSFSEKIRQMLIEYEKLIAKAAKIDISTNFEEFLQYQREISEIKVKIETFAYDYKLEQVRTENELPIILVGCNINYDKLSQRTKDLIENAYRVYREYKYEYYKNNTTESKQKYLEARTKLNTLLNNNSDNYIVGLMPVNRIIYNDNALSSLEQSELISILYTLGDLDTDIKNKIFKYIYDSSFIKKYISKLSDENLFFSLLNSCNLNYQEKIEMMLAHYNVTSTFMVNGHVIDSVELSKILAKDSSTLSKYSTQELIDIYTEMFKKNKFDLGTSNRFLEICYANFAEIVINVLGVEYINDISIIQLLYVNSGDYWSNPTEAISSIIQLSQGNIQNFIGAEKLLVESLREVGIELNLSEDVKNFVFANEQNIEVIMHQYENIYGRNKGVNQGSIRQAMTSMNRKVRNRLIQKVKERYPNISTRQAIIFLNSIEGDLLFVKTFGVCNYADVCDGIIEFFVNHPEENFKKHFGFDLFDAVTGKINEAELLLDVYMDINGDSFITRNSSSKGFDVTEFISKRSNQGYINLANHFGSKIPYKAAVIEAYLKSRGMNVRIEQQSVIDSVFSKYSDTNSATNYSNYILGKIANLLSSNKHLSISYLGKIKMRSLTNGKTSTFDGCHIMSIIGVKDGEIIVNTYGGNFAINVEHLVHGGADGKSRFTIDSFEIVSDTTGSGTVNNSVSDPESGFSRQGKERGEFFQENLTEEQKLAREREKQIKQLAKQLRMDIPKPYYVMFDGEIKPDDIVFDIIKMFKDSDVDLLSVFNDKAKFEMLKKVDKSIYGLLIEKEIKELYKNLNSESSLAKTMFDLFTENASTSVEERVYNYFVKEFISKIESSAFTDSEKSYIKAYIHEYIEKCPNDINSIRTQLRTLNTLLSKNSSESILFEISKGIRLIKYERIIKKVEKYGNVHAIIHEFEEIGIEEYKQYFTGEEYSECKTFEELYRIIDKNDRISDLENFYLQHRKERIMKILGLENEIDDKILNNLMEIRARHNTRNYEEDVIVTYLTCSDNMTQEDKQIVIDFIRKLRLNSSSSREIINTILKIKKESSNLIEFIKSVNERLNDLKVKGILKASEGIIDVYSEKDKIDFAKQLVGEHPTNHLISKFTVYEKVLSNQSLDRESKIKLTREYLTSVFGEITGSIDIESIVDNGVDSKAIINEAIRQLMNKGLSRSEIIKQMAENLNQYYSQYNITINEELLIHLLTFDSSRGQNGGFHYVTKLANVQVENVDGKKVKLYEEDSNGNKIYFKDITPFAVVDVVKQLWDNNLYSITNILDMAVNAYYTYKVNDKEVRGNGNYAYEFITADGKKGRAIFNQDGVLITVF